jgi:cephalosporin hydroxylase
MGQGYLHKYFLNNSGKRIHKLTHYFDIYEHHFERFRGTSPVMIEIGVANGGSIEMWQDYFGPGAQIIGIDLNPECAAHAGPGIDIFVGSQSDPAVLEGVFAKYPAIDIILDDGSHIMSDMIATFEFAYPRLKNRGVYMVEDTHTAYWDEFGGGWKRAGSFQEFAKDKTDELNAWHGREAFPVTEITRNTHAICFYDSVIVFEKRRQGERRAILTNSM